MSNTINPVADDFYKSIEDLADYAGDVAMQRYKIELEKGCNPSSAVSNAIEAANNVLLDSGCPNEICDALASAAIKGFTNYMNNHPNGDPMEAFDAAGESVNEVLESEFKNFDK